MVGPLIADRSLLRSLLRGHETTREPSTHSTIPHQSAETENEFRFDGFGRLRKKRNLLCCTRDFPKHARHLFYSRNHQKSSRSAERCAETNSRKIFRMGKIITGPEKNGAPQKQIAIRFEICFGGHKIFCHKIYFGAPQISHRCMDLFGCQKKLHTGAWYYFFLCG